MNCLPKHTKEWKDLVNLLENEREVTRAYLLNNNEIPSLPKIVARGLVNPNNILNITNLDYDNIGDIEKYLITNNLVKNLNNSGYLMLDNKDKNSYYRIQLLNYKYPNLIAFKPIINGYKIAIKEKELTEYNQLSEQDKSHYVNQLNNYEELNGVPVPIELKRTVEKLLLNNDEIGLDSIAGKYIGLVNNILYTRVSDFLDTLNDGYFAFSGNSDKYEINREWGTQIDFITQLALTGSDLDSMVSKYNSFIEDNGKEALVSEDVINVLHENITNLLSNNKESIFLSQIIFKNDSLKIAGTADLVEVKPDGTIKIHDIKTGLNSTSSPGYSYKYNDKASKSERHAAQLSSYIGLAMSEGFIHSEENPEIIPIRIIKESNNLIEEVEIEENVEHEIIEDIVNKVYTEYIPKEDSFANDEYKKFIDNIRITLERRLDFLNRTVATKRTRFEKGKITNLKRSISDIEKIKSINNFIDNIYDLFIRNQKTNYPGLVSDYNEFKTNYKKGNLSTDEVIDKLVYFKDSVEVFKPIIEELKTFLNSIENLEDIVEKNSPLDKVIKISNSFSILEKEIKDTLTPTIAKELNKFTSTTANKDYLKEIQQLKARLSTYKPDTKVYKLLQKRISELEDKYGEGSGVNEKSLATILEQGANEDIPFLDFLLSPIISSSNPVIALFAKKLKYNLENARQKSIEFRQDAVKAFNKFKGNKNADNSAEFNKGLYEKIKVWDNNKKEIVEKLSFTRDYDVTNYSKALTEMYNKAKEIKDDVTRSKFIDKWYNENNEVLPEDDITINGVVIEKGLNSIINEQKEDLKAGVITQKDYEDWVERNMPTINGKIVYKRQLTRPSRQLYPNATYDSMDSNKKEYYNFLVSSYFKAQDVIPEANKLGFLLPSITKSDNDRFREGSAIDYLKYQKKEFSNFTAEEKDQLGQTSNNYKVVPVLYGQQMNIEDISLDLLSSIMLYTEMSNNYKVQSDLAGFSEATLDIVSSTQPLARDSKGNKIIEQAAKKAKITDYNQYLKKHGGNNIAALLESFIDMQIYGKTRIAEETTILGKNVNLSKIADSIRGFAAKTQIGGNPLLSVANSLTANIMTQIEAVSKEFFSNAELAKAKALYFKYSKDYIKDFTEPINKSFIGQLIDLYDPMQGEYRDKYGRKVSQSSFKKLWSTDTWFFLQHQGEHAIQVQTMLAMLMRSKTTQNGKEISLLDAYELDSNGKIRLKEGVTMSGLKTQNGLVSIDMQNSLHAINKRMHGVYNTFDQVELKRYWWGRLLMMYRDFLVPGMKKRYKTFGIDQELGTITEGYYNTFWRLAVSETKEMMRELSPFHKSNLTQLEKNNVKRSVMEMGMIMATGLLVMLLEAALEGDDDDEKPATQYALYWSLRLNAELGFFGGFGDPRSLMLPNLYDTYRAFRAPTAAYGTMERIFKLIYQLGDPTERYEKSTGIWEKGDLKLEAAIFKLLGITGNTMNPDEAIKILQMQTK